MKTKIALFALALLLWSASCLAQQANIKVTKDEENRRIRAEKDSGPQSRQKATLVSDIVDENGLRTQIYDIHTGPNHYGLLQLGPTGDTLLVSAAYMDIDTTDEQGIRTKVYTFT